MRNAILSAVALSFFFIGVANSHDMWGMANPTLNNTDLISYDDLEQDLGDIPEGSNARYVVERAFLWHPGSTLRVCFMNGSGADQGRVVKAIEDMKLRENDVNIAFSLAGTCATNSSLEIRVSFQHGCCAAYVGKASYHPSLRGKPTVFFRPNLSRYIIQHEMMHTLGAHHEHQNPEGYDCFSRLRDVEGYAAKNGWDLDKVKTNLQQFARDTKKFVWSPDRDVESLTHYQISARDLVGGRRDPCYIDKKSVMSDGDYEGLRYAYPMGVGVAESSARSESGLEELYELGLSSILTSFLEATAQ